MRAPDGSVVPMFDILVIEVNEWRKMTEQDKMIFLYKITKSSKIKSS